METQTKENFAQQIAEIKNEGVNIDIRLASVLYNAESGLNSKEFKNLLKDPRVGYKPTQAKKYIKFHKGLRGQASDLVKKVGVERYYIISNIDDEQTKNNLLSFTNEYDVSVRGLGRMAKITNENKGLELNEIYEKAKITPKKEKKAYAADNSEYVSRKEFDELQEKYDSLLAEFKKCMQTLENKNNAEQLKNVINTLPDNPQRPQNIAPRYNSSDPRYTPLNRF